MSYNIQAFSIFTDYLKNCKCFNDGLPQNAHKVHVLHWLIMCFKSLLIYMSSSFLFSIYLLKKLGGYLTEFLTFWIWLIVSSRSFNMFFHLISLISYKSITSGLDWS